MVRITKIYTKTGDGGQTGLGSGARVSKDDPRVQAYGEVDEGNAAIGLAVAEGQRAGGQAAAEIAGVLRGLQHDLFDLGADLCVPISPGAEPGKALRITAAQTARLEPLIDRFNEPMAPLSSFVLPGGTPLAAALHLARTVIRRAERRVVSLVEIEPAATNAECVRYLNRLSDLLFVLARAANDDGRGDVLWTPGHNRAANDPNNKAQG